MSKFWPWPRTRTAHTSPEAKSLAAPGPDLLEIFGALPGFTGISASAEQALRVPAVSCAIRTIAEAAGSLDLAVKRIVGGVEVDAPEHPVAELLRGDVNEWTSTPELVADLVADALISDTGGVAYVSRTTDGRIAEVVRYHRSAVQVTRHPVTDEPSFSLDNRSLDPANVLHLRAPLGRAPADAGARGDRAGRRAGEARRAAFCPRRPAERHVDVPARNGRGRGA